MTAMTMTTTYWPAVASFYGDDDGYRAFREQHPDCFVLNYNEQSRCGMLHRATCPQLARATPANGYNWTWSNPKVCATHRNLMWSAVDLLIGRDRVSECWFCMYERP